MIFSLSKAFCLENGLYQEKQKNKKQKKKKKDSRGNTFPKKDLHYNFKDHFSGFPIILLNKEFTKKKKKCYKYP